MWFSSKISRKALALQLVTTHQSAAVVVDAQQNIIAVNDAFNQLSQRLKQAGHNQTFNLLLTRYDSSKLFAVMKTYTLVSKLSHSLIKT
jgi:methyl-accepting chemotaxis protein